VGSDDGPVGLRVGLNVGPVGAGEGSARLSVTSKDELTVVELTSVELSSEYSNTVSLNSVKLVALKLE